MERIECFCFSVPVRGVELVECDTEAIYRIILFDSGHCGPVDKAVVRVLHVIYKDSKRAVVIDYTDVRVVEVAPSRVVLVFQVEKAADFAICYHSRDSRVVFVMIFW